MHYIVDPARFYPTQACHQCRKRKLVSIEGETITVTEANLAVDNARNGESEGRALRWPMTDADSLTFSSSVVMPNGLVRRVFARTHTPFLMRLLPNVPTCHHGPSVHSTKVTSSLRQ